MPAENIREVERVDDEFIPADARPVCPNCFKPCHPLQNYCDSCDSNEVINPLVSYMPFVRIRFNIGMFCKLWRRICYDKDISTMLRLFYLFMVTIGAPILTIVGLPLLLFVRISEPKLRDVTILAFWVIALVLLMMLIYLNLFSGAISYVNIN
jgi:hypothetical protein